MVFFLSTRGVRVATRWTNNDANSCTQGCSSASTSTYSSCPALSLWSSSMNWLRRVSDEDNASYSHLFGERDEEDDGQSTPIYTPAPHDDAPTGLGLTLADDANPRLLSRIKHGLNSSSLGSVFARSSSPSNHKSLLLKDDFIGAADIQTPPESPNPTPRRLSGIKQVFSCSSRSYSHSRSPTDGSIKSTLSSSSSPLSSLRSKISSPSVTRHLARSASDLQSTPPLTPDTLADLVSPTSAYSQPAHHRRTNSIQINDNECYAATGFLKNSIKKKGKNPAPPFVRLTFRSLALAGGKTARIPQLTHCFSYSLTKRSLQTYPTRLLNSLYRKRPWTTKT